MGCRCGNSHWRPGRSPTCRLSSWSPLHRNSHARRNAECFRNEFSNGKRSKWPMHDLATGLDSPAVTDMLSVAVRICAQLPASEVTHALGTGRIPPSRGSDGGDPPEVAESQTGGKLQAGSSHLILPKRTSLSMAGQACREDRQNNNPRTKLHSAGLARLQVASAVLLIFTNTPQEQIYKSTLQNRQLRRSCSRLDDRLEKELEPSRHAQPLQPGAAALTCICLMTR